MTTQEVKTMMEGFGLPYAYYQFSRNTERKPPFLCFFYGDGDDFYADDINYQEIAKLSIELYTDRKDFTLERAVQRELRRRGLSYYKESTYIESQRMYMTAYEVEVVITTEETEENENA